MIKPSISEKSSTLHFASQFARRSHVSSRAVFAAVISTDRRVCGGKVPPRSCIFLYLTGDAGPRPAFQLFGACLLNIRCNVRRCILRRRAVSETLRSHFSKTRWICSQRTRSADIGSAGGAGRGGAPAGGGGAARAGARGGGGSCGSAGLS